MISLFKGGLLLLSAAIVPSIVFASHLDKVNVIPGAYIVEFEDDPAGDHLNTFFTDLSKENIPTTPRLNLSYSLFKGASFHLGDIEDEKKTVNRISSLHSVKNIYPLRRHSVPYNVVSTGHGVSASESRLRKRAGDFYSTHVMTGVDKLHAEGYAGEGINIAIVDSGVDYTHPALGGCFGPGCKISYGYDLVGDDYTGYNYPKPDSDPFDGCVGHGTHIAGIIAAESDEYGFTGVAPNVTLGMFRAIGCAGYTADDILIEAFIMAYESGADVITASIGGSSGWYQDPWAIVVSKIVAAGVPCTLAAGNDGDFGLFYSSGAADGVGVTAVASVDNVESPMLLVPGTYTANGVTNSYGWAPGTLADIANGTYPLYALTFDTSSTNDGCSPLPPNTPNLSEYIVLIQRGGCAFSEKVKNVIPYGAKHILFYNNAPGTITVEVDFYGIKSAGFVTGEQGKTWVSLMSAGYNVTLNVADPQDTILDLETRINPVTGGYASTFTSWGPTFDGQVKPQVGAPGGSILSTYPLEMGGYAILSGTSMSTPFVAGSIALIMEARGKLDPATIESLLSSTANPTSFNDGKTTYKFLAPVAQQGAGLIDVYKAVHSATTLSVSSISFNDTDHLVRSVSFSITNDGFSSVTYRLGYVPGATVYTLPGNASYPSTFSTGHPPEMVAESAKLAFNTRTVTVQSGKSVTVHVKPTLPSGLTASRIPVYSGYITLNGTNGDSLSLPYLGIASSLRNASILGTRDGLVYLSSSTYYDLLSPTVGKSLNPLRSGSTFTLPSPSKYTKTTDADGDTYTENPAYSPNNTLPVLVAQLSMGSPLVRVDIQPVNVDSKYNNLTTTTTTTTTVLGQKIIGSVPGFPARYVPRDALVTAWYGQLSDGSFVPAGRYRFVVSALRIFGDPKRREDYEQVRTVGFEIRYV